MLFQKALFLLLISLIIIPCSSFGEILSESQKEFNEKIRRLVEEQYTFTTFDEEQLCPKWTSQDERELLKVQNYDSFESYQKDFALYQEGVVAKIDELQKEKCRVRALSLKKDRIYILKEFDFHHTEEQQRLIDQFQSTWGGVRVNQLTHVERISFQTEKETSHFESFGGKGLELHTEFYTSKQAYFKFREMFISKTTKRDGYVGRTVRGDRFSYELESQYLHKLMVNNDFIGHLGGLLRIWQDSFFLEDGSQEFTINQLTLFGGGISANKNIDIGSFELKTNIYFLYKLWGQKAKNVSLESHDAFVAGGEAYFFPSKVMNYFAGAEFRYASSSFVYYNKIEKKMRESKRETASLFIKLGFRL